MGGLNQVREPRLLVMADLLAFVGPQRAVAAVLAGWLDTTASLPSAARSGGRAGG